MGGIAVALLVPAGGEEAFDRLGGGHIALNAKRAVVHPLADGELAGHEREQPCHRAGEVSTLKGGQGLKGLPF